MYNINPHMINLCNFGTKKNSINWNGEIIKFYNIWRFIFPIHNHVSSLAYKRSFAIVFHNYKYLRNKFFIFMFI